MQRQVFKKRNSGRHFRNNQNNERNSSDNQYEYNVHIGSKQYQKALQCRNKYLELAREKSASGDKVGAEEFYQFADHYVRVINEAHEISRKFKASFSESNSHANHDTNNLSVDEIPDFEDTNANFATEHVELKLEPSDTEIQANRNKRRKYSVDNHFNKKDNNERETSNEYVETANLYEEVETSN